MLHSRAPQRPTTRTRTRRHWKPASPTPSNGPRVATPARPLPLRSRHWQVPAAMVAVARHRQTEETPETKTDRPNSHPPTHAPPHVAGHTEAAHPPHHPAGEPAPRAGGSRRCALRPRLDRQPHAPLTHCMTLLSAPRPHSTTTIIADPATTTANDADRVQRGRRRDRRSWHRSRTDALIEDVTVRAQLVSGWKIVLAAPSSPGCAARCGAGWRPARTTDPTIVRSTCWSTPATGRYRRAQPLVRHCARLGARAR